MGHRRLIIQAWGSTEGYAQEEVDMILNSIRGALLGVASVFVDPHDYSREQTLHDQAGEGAIGAMLKDDFQYHTNREEKE
jgi:hypothetical protein